MVNVECKMETKKLFQTKKKNLVICVVGDISLHKSWASAEKRPFDVMLVYYGNMADKHKEDADYYLQLSGMFKFEAIAAAINKYGNIVREYKAVCLPDDDIVMSTSEMNRLFNILHKYKLDMAYPVISGGIFYDWDMWRKPDTILRYVDYVDRICPLFKINVLGDISNTFDINRSGWGIELLWGKVLKEKIAIIDDIIVQHRPSRMPSWEREYYKRLIEWKIDPYDKLAKVGCQYDVASHKKIFYREVKKHPISLFLEKFL